MPCIKLYAGLAIFVFKVTAKNCLHFLKKKKRGGAVKRWRCLIVLEKLLKCKDTKAKSKYTISPKSPIESLKAPHSIPEHR